MGNVPTLPRSSLMWEDADSLIRSELSPDETLLWTGRPKGGIRLRPFDAVLIPFSIAWNAVIAFVAFIAVAAGGPLVVLPFIPFLVIGFYLGIGRFLLDAKLRERTRYALTDQRVIIVSGLYSRKRKTLSLQTISDISLAERGDGSGTVTLGPTTNMWAWPGGALWPWAEAYTLPMLEMIENARDVYQKVVHAQRAGQS